ncbi:MAG: ketoacyl-ACP synthase III [Myxococcales bacterium]|nr:ketoacyl-ACP synthase III [Myxococcales bacterium]
MPNAYISGTGGYVPDRVVTNDDLANDYGIETSHEWIVQRTGIEARRFAPEGVCSADLAVPAAEQAIANAGLDKTDIDMIVFATLSPKHAFPGDGVYLQEKLGLCEVGRFVPAMDVRNQCSGFLYGLAAASSMVQSTMVKNVLLVGGETHSAALDLSTRGRTVASLFGDGAGAVVVSATEEDRGVRGWYLGADGRFADKLCQKVWDMTQRPFIPPAGADTDGAGQVEPELMWAHMEGRYVFKNAVERMVQSLVSACWDQGIDLKDVDLFAFHQANMRINQMVAQTMGIPDDKLIHNIHKYGNTTAATIPLLLAEAEQTGRLTRGMKVACVAFGSGFTWGTAIVDW